MSDYFSGVVPADPAIQIEYTTDGLTRLTITSSQAVQDYVDGAALRRLREALPNERVHLTIGLRAINRKGAYPLFMTATDGRVYYGHTIAEAADKCREALG